MRTRRLRTALAISGLLLAASRAEAQLVPFGESGVVMGHIHVTASDVAAMRKYFIAMGGVSLQDGRLIQFPGAFIMVREGQPTGGTAGTTVNHFGFKVKNLQEAKERWKAAGITPEAGSNYFVAPGGLRIEIHEDPSITHPIEMYHIHFWLESPPEVQAWYAKMFGSVSGQRAAGDNTMYVGDLPGVNLTFSDVARMGKPVGIFPPMAPTKGRVLDHIGFEVRNLEQFCKKLEAAGVKFDRPYAHPNNSPLAVAFLTDPWGTYIELTENLAPPK